jgi:hypothetical protein
MVERDSEQPWPLSAPESLVLLTGPETGDAVALRAALLELVVRRSLKLSQVTDRRLLLFHRTVTVFTGGSHFTRRLDPPLQRLLDLYPQIPTKRYPDGVFGVPVRKFAREILSQHRPSYQYVLGRRVKVLSVESYVGGAILPELVKRGFYLCNDPYQGSPGAALTCTITEQGIETLSVLKDLLDEGRRSFAGWVEADPKRAMDFVERAGPAFLLLPALAPSVRRLHAQQLNARIRPKRTSSAFGVIALAGLFGPGLDDGFDAASYTLAHEVDLAWEAILRRGGGDGAGE